MAWQCRFFILIYLGIVCSHCLGLAHETMTCAVCALLKIWFCTFRPWFGAFRCLIWRILALDLTHLEPWFQPLSRCIAALDLTNFGSWIENILALHVGSTRFGTRFNTLLPWFHTFWLLIRHISSLGSTHFGPSFGVFWPLIRHISALDSKQLGHWFDTFLRMIRCISVLDSTRFGPWFDTFRPLMNIFRLLIWNNWIDILKPFIRDFLALDSAHLGCWFDSFRPFDSTHFCVWLDLFRPLIRRISRIHSVFRALILTHFGHDLIHFGASLHTFWSLFWRSLVLDSAAHFRSLLVVFRCLIPHNWPLHSADLGDWFALWFDAFWCLFRCIWFNAFCPQWDTFGSSGYLHSFNILHTPISPADLQ